MNPIVTDAIWARIVVCAVLFGLVVVMVPRIVGAIHSDDGRALGRAPAIAATWGLRRI